MESARRTTIRARARRSQGRHRGLATAWLIVCGCGRFSFDGSADAGANLDAPLAVCHTGTFTPPVPLSSNVTSPSIDWGASQSFDGKSIYFSSDRSGIEELYVTSFDGATWSLPARIEELVSGTGREGNPAIRADGRELLWGQALAGIGGIHHATRSDVSSPWSSDQVLLQDTAAFTGVEGPEISFDGKTLYFTAQTQGGGGPHSMFSVPYDRSQPPRRLTELDEPTGVGWPSVTSDELEMFYSANEPSRTEQRLMRATRANRSDPWTPMGAVNELDVPAVVDNDSAISQDGRTIVFSSKRSGGQYDLYTATRSCD